MMQETLDFTAKLSINNFILMVLPSSTKDQSDQKSYTEYRFEAELLLGNLTNDLKIESLARSGWTNILNVKTGYGKVLNILDSSAIITV